MALADQVKNVIDYLGGDRLSADQANTSRIENDPRALPVRNYSILAIFARVAVFSDATRTVVPPTSLGNLLDGEYGVECTSSNTTLYVAEPGILEEPTILAERTLFSFRANQHIQGLQLY